MGSFSLLYFEPSTGFAGKINLIQIEWRNQGDSTYSGVGKGGGKGAMAPPEMLSENWEKLINNQKKCLFLAIQLTSQQMRAYLPKFYVGITIRIAVSV